MNPEMKQKIAHAVATLEGWCGLEKAEYIALLVLDAAPEKIVEIGVFGGKSVIPMALAAKQYGAHVWAIDPWSKQAALEGSISAADAQWWGSIDLEAIYSGFIGAVDKFGLLGTITTLRMTDQQALPQFEDGSIGVLHVDGNHTPEVSRRYITQWGAKIKPGGYLIMDDTDWPSQAETLKLIEIQYQLVKAFPSWAVYRKG